MKKLHLAPTVQSSGPLTSLIDMQTELAWQLLKQMPAPPAMTREQFLQASAAHSAGRVRELHSWGCGDRPAAEDPLFPRGGSTESELHAGHAAAGQAVLRRP